MNAVAECSMDVPEETSQKLAVMSASGSLNLRVVKTDREFTALRASWNALTDEPLQSFEWNNTWWQNLGVGCELNVYCLERDGVVVGIAPFFRDSWFGQSRLRFLGSGQACTDYAQVITTDNYQTFFINAIAKDVRKQNLQMVELEGITGQDPAAAFRNALDADFWSYKRELEPAWVLDLPDGWEAFLKNSKSSLRRKIRKAEERLSGEKCLVRSTLDGSPWDAAFDTLVDLHQRRFVSKGEVGVFRDPNFTEFLRSAGQALSLRRKAEIITIYFDGKPLVAGLYLHSGSGTQFYQSGMDVERLALEPGHLAFAYAIKKTLEGGSRKFDFLRGNEPYKRFWGALPRELATVCFVSKQVVPSAISKTFLSLRSLKQRGSLWCTRG